MYALKISMKNLPITKAWMQEFPEKIQQSLFVKAGKKIGEDCVERARRNTPRRKVFPKPGPWKKPPLPWRMADTFIYKVARYRKSGVVAVIVGPKSGSAPHGILVEKGSYKTPKRYTKHRSLYAKIPKPPRQYIAMKKGKPVLKWSKTRYRKLTRGSFRKNPMVQGVNRGRMPAFRPLYRAVQETQRRVDAVLRHVLGKELQRLWWNQDTD